MSGAIVVARARLEEVQPLAAEYRREAAEGGMTAEPPLPTGALFWIARNAGGTEVGYAAGTLRPEGLVLGPVYVRAEFRRGGAGRRLLHEIEQWASGAQIPLVEVSVAADNEAGVRFLEAAGFEVRRHLMARRGRGASA